MRRIDAPMVDGMITAPLLSLFVIRAIYEPVCVGAIYQSWRQRTPSRGQQLIGRAADG
jgi:hypothetical protein